MRKISLTLFGTAAALVIVAVGSFVFVTDARSPSVAQRLELISVNDKLTDKQMAGTYEFDKAHSYIGFKIRHMGLINVPGAFKDFTGQIDFNAEDPKRSSVDFAVKMKSVDTRVDARDNHLRSKDFFEVEKYPEMKFKSKSIEKKANRYIVKGDLTMKDVTKEIEIPVSIYGPIEDARGSIRMGVIGSTGINRREFNVNYGGDLPNGTPVLADTVIVDIQIESVKKKPAEAQN